MTDELEPGPEMDVAVAKAIGEEVLRGFGVGAIQPTDGLYGFYPSADVDDAILALGATDEEFIITSIVGDPGQRAFTVRIEDVNIDEPFVSTRCATLPEAACRAILEWAKDKESQP